MRKCFLILPVLALAACEPAVPNSGAGVGFGDYQDYLAQREAQLQGQKTAPILASGSGYTGGASAPAAATSTTAQGYGATPLNATNLSMTTAAAAPAGTALPAASGDGSIGSDAMAALRATAPAGVTTTPTATASAPSEKACAKYVSPDLAQMAFLEKGGPQKDPGNLDPDGDGFACGWDPRPFQAARR